VAMCGPPKTRTSQEEKRGGYRTRVEAVAPYGRVRAVRQKGLLGNGDASRREKREIKRYKGCKRWDKKRKVCEINRGAV